MGRFFFAQNNAVVPVFIGWIEPLWSGSLVDIFGEHNREKGVSTIEMSKQLQWGNLNKFLDAGFK